MNRSFRAPESQMLAAMKQRQQLRASVMREKDEELALFLEMKKREKERNDLLLNHSEEFDAPLGSKPGTSPIFNLSSTPAPPRKTGPEDFLNSESDKNDYDWLLTPPGTPLFPSLEMGSQKTVMSQLETPKARPTALKSRMANPQLDIPARSSLAPKQPASSSGLNSSRSVMNTSAGTRRPSSSGGPGSRPATPTGRPTLPASKSSRPSTPTSRPSLPSSRPSLSATKPSLTAKPSSTAKSSPIAKPTISSRSITTPKPTPRSSTPTSRPTLPPPKSTPRASTPTRRPSTPSSSPSMSASLNRSSSSITKPVSTGVRNPAPPRAASPSVKPRPWKPSEMPGFSLDAPPNLRTTLPDRPLSATRGRPGAPSSRSSSVEPGPPGRPRRQSCSPSRGRAPNGMSHYSGGSVPAVSRSGYKINDNVSPALVGTKMVERVINMRKLVPPRQDDKHSPHGNSAKSSSPDSSGFGRSLSKKSLDMAIRHMDIRKSIPGNLRPLMTNIPASSMYSVRSGPHPGRSRTISISDSPLATSSNASSELSVNNNGLCFEGSELEDDIGSERGTRSPAVSMRGR